jgi:hypothetical protein
VALNTALALVIRAAATSDPLRSELAQQARATIDADPALADDVWLTAPLVTFPPDLPAAQARLDAALVTLDDRPSTEIAGGRAALDQILADPRFHPVDWISLLPAWLIPLAVFVNNLITWIGDQIDTLLEIVLSSRAFAYTLAVLAVAAAAAVAVLYRAGLRASLVRQAETPLSALPLPPTAAEALREAREQAVAARYRDACHHALLGALLSIEEQDGVHFDRSATNREHLRRIAGEPGHVPPAHTAALERIVARFDPLWYGQVVVTREEFDAIMALAESILAVRA